MVKLCIADLGRVVITPVMLVALSGIAHGEVTFVKIADTETPIPGGSGTFRRFDVSPPPAIDMGLVAFVNGDDGNTNTVNTGIYTAVVGGPVGVVANTDTIVPGRPSSTFRSFGEPSVDGRSRQAGFVSDPVSAVYRSSGGPQPGIVVDANTAVPPAFSETFQRFGSPMSVDDRDAAFVAWSPAPATQGIYAIIDDVLQVAADATTLIPGDTSNFLEFGRPSLDDGLVVFSGGAMARDAGIYTYKPGTLDVIADRGTPRPGGGIFRFFGRNPAVSDDAVVFWAATSIGSGIFTNLGGTLRVVADTTTEIPGRVQSFTSFDTEPSIDAGVVAFKGRGAGGTSGIYIERNGELTKVIDLNDTLDGKDLLTVRLGREGFSDGIIAFHVGFTDESEGIYVARLASSVPETHIDFDFDASGAPISHLERIDDEYSDIGVHFTGDYWVGQTSIAFDNYTVRPSPNYLCTFGGTAGGANAGCIRDGQDPPNVPLEVELDFPAVFASIEGYTRNDGIFDSDGLSIEAFDENGISLGVGQAQCTNDPPPHTVEGVCVAFVESTGIRQLVISGVDFPDALDSLWITPATQLQRNGDFNGDGCVDRADFAILVAVIRGSEPRDLAFDLNEDGAVNRADARTQVGLFDNLRGETCSEALR